jgi:hypothetical protein
MTLELKPCADSFAWDDFVTKSPQGNVFCRTALLSGMLDVEYDLWFVEDNGIPQAGAIILKRDGLPVTNLYPFVLYQGLLLAGHSRSFPIHRRTAWLLKVLQTLLEGLSARYSHIALCLHHTFDDLRGLQWFNYHQEPHYQFQLILRYTGLIDLTRVSDFDAYLSTLPQTRRYHYRKAAKHGFELEKSEDVDLLEYLYKITFVRQGYEVPTDDIRSLRLLASATLAHGIGELLACRDPRGEIASIMLSMHDEKCSYYVAGGNHPDFSRFYSGTFLFLENIRRSMELGLQCLDVVGMNSPNRGDFKSSCNASVVPYYLTFWNDPQRSV